VSPRPPAPAAGGPDIDAATLTAVRGHACPTRPFACEAIDRFEAASAPAATTQAWSRVGRAFSTYNAWRGEEVDWFVARPGELMAFGDVVPENDEERRQADEVLGWLRAGQPVPSTHPVAGFVASLATGGSPPHPTALRGRSRHYRQEGMNADVYIRHAAGEVIVIKASPTGAAIAVFRMD